MYASCKTLTALFAICPAAAGCGQGISGKNSFVLAEGDLLFQDIDCGRLCDAIEKVTTGCGGANFSHVGIAAREGTGEIVVIEAASSGAASTPLDSFLGKSLEPAAKPKVAVGRGGINPGGISRSPAITIIHAYGTCDGGANQ